MAALLRRLFLTAVLLVGAANSQGFEGEACTYRLTGLRGACTPLRTCKSAINALKKGVPPQTCSFQGTSPIVCCPADGDAPPVVTAAPPTPAPTEPPVVVTRVPPPIPRPSGNQCPPLPSDAIKVQPTGQKAWDKCIELAQTVYPCVSSSFLLNSPKIRHNNCKHVSTPLIVGGSPTESGEFPHMALLGFGDQPEIHWDCGGTLISDLWVMSAGHCTFSRDYGDVKFVRLGGEDTNIAINPDNLYTIASIVPHPEYLGNSKYNDIALLKLDRTVVFTGLIRPACLHTGQKVNDTKAVATGWGTVKSRGDKSTSLLKVTLEKFNHTYCALKNPKDRKSMDGVRDASQVCFGHQTEVKDTCQGDSGGPLQLFNDDRVYCTYLIIGVTSYGKVCGVKGQPAIYSRVSFFVPWIESVVWP